MCFDDSTVVWTGGNLIHFEGLGSHTRCSLALFEESPAVITGMFASKNAVKLE